MAFELCDPELWGTKVYGDTGEEERIKRQTSVPGIEPGPSDLSLGALDSQSLGPGSMPGTEVCLFILSSSPVSP